MSDLVSARPFSARPSSLVESVPRSASDHLSLSSGRPATVATVRPVSSYHPSPDHLSDLPTLQNSGPSTVTVKPLSVPETNGREDTPSKKDKIRERHKGTPRGRFLTVSSSSPVKLEQSPVKRDFKHTAAGDLIISSVSQETKALEFSCLDVEAVSGDGSGLPHVQD